MTHSSTSADLMLVRARASFERRAWRDAAAQFETAESMSPLDGPDSERLATALHLAGDLTSGSDAWARAHQTYLAREDAIGAVRSAFWLAFGLLMYGEHARANGWLARARRLLSDDHDCVEQGYLLLTSALQAIFSGDAATAYATFADVAGIADRFADDDLAALARNGQGRALIRLGRVAEGVALLDETMAGIEAGAVAPMVAGDVYCSLIEACHEILDLRRAQEWTAALSHWCETQPDLVPYRGQCLVRRAELMQLHGSWNEALREAQRACEQLADPLHPAVGAAFYQRAELHRLRGEFAEAETAYHEAARWSRKPRPGLALLRRAQGDHDAAAAAMRVLLAAECDRVTRVHVLAAHVEIALAASDVDAARNGAAELSEISASLDVPFVRALTARARGAVLLHEGMAHSALTELRASWGEWHDLEAPYEAARTRVLIALAARELGDEDTAQVELTAASSVFERVGAAPDLAQLDRLLPAEAAPAPGGLSRREVDVLRLVATGMTNRAIAAELFISEKTVARHMSNIFGKLGVSTRAAAAAYAFKHDLA